MPVDQRLRARSSVFAGGFELHAAEQVCGAGSTEDVLELEAAQAITPLRGRAGARRPGRTMGCST
ncbi:hypothetical protein [Nocardia sp. CA-135398]|uniref:hypothetical protein n=1 Tax=Nocardia sp. CA-135398 TaxID=3239977 RepID=UPI003D9831D5